MTASRPVVDYERRLVEAAVLASLGGRAEERLFLGERDRLYEVADPEAREEAFAALHGAWFARLGLGQPAQAALDERPEIEGRSRRCIVARALAARDEAADLLIAPPEPPTILIRVLTGTLCVPDRFRRFLRHELLHIADMLDPGFGYEPRLPGSGGGALRDRALAGRYRVLWDAWVDGRLARIGWAPAAIREERFAEFARAFPELGDRAPEAFDRFFGAARCTHADLVAFAARSSDEAPRSPCPLCGPATGAAHPVPGLPPAVLAAIRSDFPSWDPAAGLCQRCAELYSARVAIAS